MDVISSIDQKQSSGWIREADSYNLGMEVP